MPSVAFKIGRGQGGFAGESPHGALTANPTQPPAYFQCNPEGCGSLAIFLRCSLGQDHCGYCRFVRALKNGQIADSRRHGIYSAAPNRQKRTNTLPRLISVAPAGFNCGCFGVYRHTSHEAFSFLKHWRGTCSL